jgi:transmembrane 9 superfamily protein 2/4
MKLNQSCKMLCTKGGDKSDPTWSADDVATLVKRIGEDYYVNWMVDNLPAAEMRAGAGGWAVYGRGIPIGFVDQNLHVVYNHHKLYIKYHEDSSFAGARVVGFEVLPMSVHQTDKVSPKCKPDTGMEEGQSMFPISGPDVPGKGADGAITITYSYDVFWVPSDLHWASRWDIYLSLGDTSNEGMHLNSIANSTVVAVFLTFLVGAIMTRILHKDISKYNQVRTEEDKAEEEDERGWKLVHTDVFRPPARAPLAFAVLVGIASQILAMSVTTIVFAAVGFLSPANRGSMALALLLTYLLFGIIAGYAAARTHKMLNGTQWQRVTIITALAFPGFIFTVLFILNMAVYSTGSTNYVNLLNMFLVLALWLTLSVPLTWVGAFYGFKADKVELPTRVAPMPRPIPPQPWYLRAPVVMAVGGMLPFAVVFVEVFFMLTAMWTNLYYYVFGFLLAVWLLLIVMSAEVAIVLTYFQLCSEDYRWWWRSMLVPGASGVWLYAYCIYYYFNVLEISGVVPELLYFSYMGLVALAFSFVTGAAGYLGTSWFLRKIYGAVRVD